VKLNSADHQSPTGLQVGLEQIELINAEKIDFLEISGGTYEDPKVSPICVSHRHSAYTALLDAPKSSVRAREKGLDYQT